MSSTLTPCSSGQSPRFDVFGNTITDFVGRKTELGDIDRHFSKASNDRPRIFSILGFPGEGKTRLAQEFCHKSQQKYRGMYWINAKSDMTALHSFVRIANALGLGKEEVVNMDPFRSVRLVDPELKLWSERWLMVFDSYDQPEKFPDIKRLIPPGIVQGFPCCQMPANLRSKVEEVTSFSQAVVMIYRNLD